MLDHPAQTRRFYIETARGRSEVLTLSVLALPRVEAVSAVLRPPAYTGWPETKQRVGPAGIDLLEGGEAQFQIDCSMPVPGARVRFTPDGGKPVESACQADPKNDRRLLLAWLATASGELEVTPRNAAGLAARAPLHLRVTALPDAPPSIHVTDPEPLLYAPEGDRVTVRVSASDDVAVAKVLTLRAANNWGPFASPVAFKPSPDAGRVTGEFTFDLGALGAKAGDVIKYCAVAEDGRPEAAGAQNAVKGAAKRGPQRAQSDTQAIRVISRQEYLRHLREERRVAEITEEAHRIQDALAALKTQREEALQAEQVAAEIIREKSEKGQPLTDADHAALAKASEKTAAFAKAAKEAADRAAKRAKEPAAYGFEKKYLEDMAKMADQLKEQAILADDADNAAKEAAAGKDAKAQQRMREALDRFRDKHEPFGDQSELKQDTQGLDKLAATDALKSLQDDLKALALDQAELEKDLARFNRRESLNEEEKLQAAQLGKRQKDLRRQLADITGEMQQVLRDDGDKIPKQAAKARDLLNNLMGEAVAQDMDDAGTLAEAGDGRMAHAAAASAAEKLLRLLKPSAKDDNEDEDAKDDLEDALGMDEGALGECLGQMGEARGAGEGQSSGTGQGEGRGKGRGRGRGHGQGASQADGGGEGRTHGRKSVKAAVHGAQGDSQGKSGASDGRGKGAGHGQGAGNGGDAAHATPAENIEAGADAGRDAKGTPMPGVPPVYRGLTEQYFKRVLEDSNKNNGGQP